MCPSNADPNGERKPGEPFRYKPGIALEPSEGLIQRFLQCGMKNLTHEETAAILGVSRSTLELFWGKHEDHKQAFLDGKQMRKVKLRAMGDTHAALDPATWRFVAKNELGLSDDPSKARLDEQATKTLKGMTREEANKRILELKPKLIGEQRIVSRETYTTQENGDVEAAESRDRPMRGELSPSAKGTGESPQGGGAPQGQVSAGEGRGSAPAAGKAVEALQKRLAELEASAVRKNPRKDGQPHTDRSKLSEATKGPRKEGPDRDANRRQEIKPAHAPGRLPGRLGST